MTTTENRPQGRTEPDDVTVGTAVLDRLLQVLDDGASAILAGIGHDTGLFDTLAALPPATSAQVADAAGLDERYVREWLGGVVSAGFVDFDPTARTYALRADHAPFLSGPGPDNLARMMRNIGLMGSVAPAVAGAFRTGGGLSYADYPRFHEMQAAETGPVQDAYLVDSVLPLTGEVERLRSGIDVLDVGCGRGHAVNLMARAFPQSRFTGVDFEEEAIAAARAEAAAWGLSNARFDVRDAADLTERESHDLVTAFDAIHDQAAPARVLANIARTLRPAGRSSWRTSPPRADWRTTSSSRGPPSCTRSRRCTACRSHSPRAVRDWGRRGVWSSPRRWSARPASPPSWPTDWR